MSYPIPEGASHVQVTSTGLNSGQIHLNDLDTEDNRSADLRLPVYVIPGETLELPLVSQVLLSLQKGSLKLYADAGYVSVTFVTASSVQGDLIELDFDPVTYVPNTVPAEVTEVNQLSAHLSGIDAALAGVSSGLSNLYTSHNNTIQTVASVYTPNNPPNDGLFTRERLEVEITSDGLYKFEYSYNWTYDATDSNFVFQIVEEPNTVHFRHIEQPSSSSGSNGEVGTDQQLPVAGFILLPLTTGSYVFHVAFGGSAPEKATVFSTNFVLYKVS